MKLEKIYNDLVKKKENEYNPVIYSNTKYYQQKYGKEINPSDTNDKKVINQVLKQYFENGNKMPTEEELKAQVTSGDLIYVDNYTRSDGTKVSGYYRACNK